MKIDIISKKEAFTLAEALITIAVVAIVALLIRPLVWQSTENLHYNAARLKALKTFGDAGSLASIHNEIRGHASAEVFVNDVLSKYLNIEKVCKNPSDCNFPSKIQPSNLSAPKKEVSALRKWNEIGYNGTGTHIESPNDNADYSIFVTTKDKFSALIHYNPKCVQSSQQSKNGGCDYDECEAYALDEICMNAIYDMNGADGPNHVGEDIGFVTVFWSGLKAVAVAPGMISYDKAKAIYDKNGAANPDAQKFCEEAGTDKDPYTLPNIYELQSLMANQFLNGTPASGLWSGSAVADRPDYMWAEQAGGFRSQSKITDTNAAWCVKR